MYRVERTPAEGIRIVHKRDASDMTIRNVPKELTAALEREQRRRGTSMDQTVIDLLREGLGVKSMENEPRLR